MQPMTPQTPTQALAGPGDEARRLALEIAEAALERYLAGCESRVPDFARRRLGLAGSLRLHRHAAGWDVAKAPVNILLGIANLAADLLGRLALRLGRRRLGAWLRGRHWVLPTRVMQQLDLQLRTELLHWPLDRDGRPTGVDGPLAALLAEARLRAPAAGAALPALRPRIDPEAAHRVDRLIARYLAGRTAVAEVMVALASTLLGWWLFGAAAPGAIALSAPVADLLSLREAIAAFPLGKGPGQVWYGLFGVDTPWYVTAATALWLTVLFAIAAAFAGLVADPLESLTGSHRRRLHRLVRAIGAALRGDERARLSGRAQYLARLFDLLDLAQAAARGLT